MITTIDDIVKLIDSHQFPCDNLTLLSDVFHISAISISNKINYSAEREKEYMNIIKKYDEGSRKVIAEIFSMLFLILSNQIDPAIGFNDHLGELYMKSNTSSKKAGQFFTPYHISRMVADTDLSKEIVDNNDIITVCEPSCGSGGMIIATADLLWNKYKVNYTEHMMVECSDIDSRCVHMAYVQFSLAGIPAIIYHQNALTKETYSRWETPAYIINYRKFDKVLKGN